MGQVVLKNYVTVYDYDTYRVGFIGNFKEGLPLHNTFPGWGIALIVLAVLAVLIGVGIFIFIRIRNKRLEERLNDYNELDKGDKKVSIL